MKSNFSQNIDIVKQLTITDFKLRYSGSILGYLWSLLKPIGLFFVMYLVFGQMLKFGDSIENFPTYLLIGIVLWNFFSEVTSNGLQSIVSRADLIKKIYFPRIIVVLVSSLSALINLGFNLVVLALFMSYFKINVFDWDTLLIIPYLLELWLIGLGISLFLSSLYVKYRDIAHIWELVLQVMFYLTPIIYPLALVPARFHSFLLLNPLAQMITDFRHIFIEFDYVQAFYYPWPQIIVTLIVFIVGFAFFQYQEKSFAEQI